MIIIIRIVYWYFIKFTICDRIAYSNSFGNCHKSVKISYLICKYNLHYKVLRKLWKTLYFLMIICEISIMFIVLCFVLGQTRNI